MKCATHSGRYSPNRETGLKRAGRDLVSLKLNPRAVGADKKIEGMFKGRRILVAGALLPAVLSGCAPRHTPDQRARTNPPEPIIASAHYPVIVRMVARNQTITVTAGPHGPLYSAATAAGRVLVSNVTLEQLRTTHPDVFRQVEPTLALDARAD